MGAAPIRACHRRALRHPVPQAPERAFIVARARRKAFFMAPSVKIPMRLNYSRLPLALTRMPSIKVLTTVYGYGRLQHVEQTKQS